MQIKELTLPANQKKITYQICKSGQTNIYTTYQLKSKTTYFQEVLSKIQLGQLNSIQITPQNQLQNIFEKNPFQQAKIQLPKQHIEKQICCSCKKSRCLKLYCECFAKKFFCTKECQCKACANTQINAKKLLFFREEVVIKKQTHERGCRCQKSGCNKKYCECFSRQQKCGQHCECLNCQNFQHLLKIKNQKY